MKVQNALESAIAHKFNPLCNSIPELIFVQLEIVSFSFALCYSNNSEGFLFYENQCLYCVLFLLT